MQIAPASPQKLNQKDTSSLSCVNKTKAVWHELQCHPRDWAEKTSKVLYWLLSVQCGFRRTLLPQKEHRLSVDTECEAAGRQLRASNVQESDPVLCRGGCIAFVPSSSIGLDAHARTKGAAPLTVHHFSDCGKQRPHTILGYNRLEWFLKGVQCLKWPDAQVNEKAYFPWVSLWFSPDLHIDQWGKVLTSTKVNFLDNGLRSTKISSSDGTGNFMFF